MLVITERKFILCDNEGMVMSDGSTAWPKGFLNSFSNDQGIKFFALNSD